MNKKKWECIACRNRLFKKWCLAFNLTSLINFRGSFLLLLLLLLFCNSIKILLFNFRIMNTDFFVNSIQIQQHPKPLARDLLLLNFKRKLLIIILIVLTRREIKKECFEFLKRHLNFFRLFNKNWMKKWVMLCRRNYCLN